MVEKKNPFLRRQSEPYKKRVGESKSHKIGSITQGHRPKQATKIQNLLQLLRDWKAGKYPNVPLAGLLYRMNYSTGKLGPAGGSDKPGKHLRYFLRDFLDNNTRVTNYNPKYGLREYVTQKEVVDAVGKENVRELKTALSKSEGIKTRIGAVGKETSRQALLARKADLAKLAKDPVIQKLMNTGQGTIKIVRGKELNNVMTDLVDRGMKVLDMNSNQVERRLNMLGIALKNKDPDLPKFTNDKMIQKISKAGSFSGAGKLIYGIETAKALGQADNFIDRSLRDISIKLKDAGIKGYNLDEIFGGTSSGLRKSYPYGVFGQIIRGGKATRGLFKRPTIDQKELINQLKGSDIDARKSVTEDNLQNIDREYEKYKAAKNNPSKRGSRYRQFPDRLTKNGLKMRIMQDFNRTAQKFKRQHGVAVPLFSDKPPSQVVKDYHNFKNPNSKFYFDIGEGKYLSDALDDVHKKFGYSMVVPKNTGTLKTILKDLDNPTIIETLRSKVKRLPPRIYGPVIGAYLGYQGFKNLFNTPVNADTIQLQTAGLSGGETIPKVDLVPGSVDQVSEEVIQEPGTTELEATDIQVEEPASMMYNATEGNFVNAEGEREDQMGVLDWIAENPTKSSLMAMPLAMGAGFALEAGSKFGNESVAKRGLGSAGKYLKGWKAVIPAMMIPHAMHEYKAGYDLPEMATNPINALWALGIGKAPGTDKYYQDRAARLLGDPKKWEQLKIFHKSLLKDPKSFGQRLLSFTMSPATKGTDLAFAPWARKPFKAAVGALEKETMKKGLGYLASRGALALGAAAALPFTLVPGMLTAGLLGADFLWDQYKDYRDGKIRVDEMRARGQISEEEAKNYMSLIKQGSIPFGIGNRMFGPETMRIGGQDLDPTQQRETLRGMEEDLDLWQSGDMKRRAKFREDHFEEGGRVGMKFGGNINRRDFLKMLAALAAGAAGIFKGKSKDVVKPLVVDATKAIPAKFIGVEGMPVWFPRAVYKIKQLGKLTEMADKHYVQGDIYEMMIPVKVPKFDRVAGKELPSGFETRLTKVTMEENPLTGEINMSWTGTDNFGDDAVRQINFRPGSAGYQKFGVDDADAAARGVTEYQRVKVEEPEFSYSQPDQSQPYRDDVEFLDILTEGDEVVGGLEKLTGTKNVVMKDGTVMDITDYSKANKEIDEAFQKKIYKDIEGEEAIIPEPEGTGVSSKGDIYGEEQYNEILGGEIPEHLKKKAKGGIIETGNIAREPGLVPPLSGPTPQGEGIVGLFSNPKHVNVGS